MSIFPNERRHTLYFLQHAKKVRSVYLDTDIDASDMLALQAKLKGSGEPTGFAAMMIYYISQSLAANKNANVSAKGLFFPKLFRHDSISAKFTLDKTTENTRIVVSAILPRTDEISLLEIQQGVSFHKNAKFSTSTTFSNLRKLQSLPAIFGYAVYSKLMKSFKGRKKLHGNFTLTSLGKYDVNGFAAISGGTYTFGAGTIKSRPVVSDGIIVPAPVFRVTMAFDHRALDGAMAAELLSDIKNRLETCNSENPTA